MDENNSSAPERFENFSTGSTTFNYYGYSEDDYGLSDVIKKPEKNPEKEADYYVRLFSVVVYSITCVLGVLGNGIVIAVICLRMKKSVHVIYLLQLAIADFLFTSFLPLTIVYTALNFHWIFGKVMCKLASFILILNMFTSVFLLTIISLDRCISVIYPVWSQNHRTTELASCICIVAWVLASLLSLPSLFFRDTVTRSDGVTSCFNNYSLSVSRTDSEDPKHISITIARVIIGFLVCFIIITVSYLILIFKLKRNRLAKSRKPLKIILCIIVAFFVCWCPYHVLSILEIKYSSLDISIFRFGMPMATALATANSCMNPVLYVFMGQDFKQFKTSILSMLANALSDDPVHSRSSHQSFSKVSSITEKESIVL
uniref:Chemerin-like receptor 1 n=1 Tax=Geotrypetes seraphini TaxID=260995 RepID=A0A6P8S2T7_GEOSA|nr:chemokine-like receptor 1 [Geotrypetes seraphini]XP_033812149.1 chemokine-like receptor 1 [Geotrypetes seraphini]